MVLHTSSYKSSSNWLWLGILTLMLFTGYIFLVPNKASAIFCAKSGGGNYSCEDAGTCTYVTTIPPVCPSGNWVNCQTKTAYDASGNTYYRQVCSCDTACDYYGKQVSGASCGTNGSQDWCNYTYGNNTCYVGPGSVCTREQSFSGGSGSGSATTTTETFCPSGVYDIAASGGSNITVYMGETATLGFQLTAGPSKNIVNVATEVVNCPAGATCSPANKTVRTVYASDGAMYSAVTVTPQSSGIQTYTVQVKAYDDENPGCFKTVNYNVTVKPSRKMVCDSQWHDIPFGPNAYYTPGPAAGLFRVTDNINYGTQLFVMHRGSWIANSFGSAWTHGLLNTTCNYPSNNTATECVWGLPAPLPFSTTAYGWNPYKGYEELLADNGYGDPLLNLSMSGTRLLTRIRFTNSSRTYSFLERNAGGWSLEGNTSYAWGQPTTMVDTAGRTITLNNGTNYLQYKCDPPAAQVYSYNVSGSLSFSAQRNGALPASQDIQVTNTGNQTLTLGVSESISWANINKNSLTLTPGQTGTVTVNITTTALAAGTQTGSVVFSHAQAGNKNTAINYEVTGTAPVCDNNWHEVPGGGVTPSQPVGIAVPRNPAPGDPHPTFDSQYYDSILMSVRAIGSASSPHVQACRFNGGSECTFDGSWQGLGASTSYPPYLWLGWSVAMEIKDQWTANYQNINYLTGWDGWKGPNADPGWHAFGQPFRTTDKRGRTWQFSKNSLGRVLYACGASVCVPLEHNSASSTLSSTTVAIGQTFTAKCDYGVKGIDSITLTAPAGINCAYQAGSSFGLVNPTQAVYSCAVQTGAQSGAVSCGLRNNSSSFTCSQTNTIGNITINRATIGLNPNNFSFNKTAGGPVPASQNLTVTNTGAGTLRFTARTDQAWCRINGQNNTGSVTGNLGAGTSQTIGVSVDNYDTASTRNCTITVTDPDASNNPQTIPVVYTVSAASTPSYSVTPSLTFSATQNGAVPGSQNIAVTNTGTVTLTIGINEAISWATIDKTSIILTPGQTGSVVVSLTSTNFSPNTYTGTINFTNAQAGNKSTTINYQITGSPPPPPPQPPVVTNSGLCERIVITWVDGSGNEDGFRVYKGSTNNAAAATLIATVGANQTTYTYNTSDTSPYYYFVSAFSNTTGESTRVTATPAGIAAFLCSPNISNSDKDIIGITPAQGTNRTWSNTGNDCGGFDGAPASYNIIYREGDIVTFEINICNTTGNGDATVQRVVDTLANMNKPTAGWNAKYQDSTNPNTWVNITPAESGSFPSRVLTFNYPANYKVPKGASRKLVFDAQLQLADPSTEFSRFYNRATIYVLNVAPFTVNTPAILFFKEGVVPSRNEIPPG